MNKQQSTTRSIDRALEILECFLYYGKSLSVADISEITDLSVSTVHRIISALERKDFLQRNLEDKKYRLGPKIAEFGKINDASTNHNIIDIAKPYMTELAEKYNEDVRLFIADGQDKLCIESIESSRSLRHIMRVGDKHILHKGAAGKVLLAHMEKSQQEHLIKDTNITQENLERIKQKGYALSIGEKEEGLVGIGAPIVDRGENIIAALSLSGPSERFINEELNDKISDTIATAKKISDLYLKIKAL